MGSGSKAKPADRLCERVGRFGFAQHSPARWAWALVRLRVARPVTRCSPTAYLPICERVSSGGAQCGERRGALPGDRSLRKLREPPLQTGPSSAKR